MLTLLLTPGQQHETTVLDVGPSTMRGQLEFLEVVRWIAKGLTKSLGLRESGSGYPVEKSSIITLVSRFRVVMTLGEWGYRAKHISQKGPFLIQTIGGGDCISPTKAV
jgi:hypothetical protein